MSRTGAKVRGFLGLFLMLAASLSLAQVAGAQADPGISTTQTSGPATVGQPYIFNVTATNNSVPQNVGLKNFLPEGMSLDAATPSQGTCGASHHGDNAVECSLGKIPSGGSATVEVVATPTVPGTGTNTAVGQGEVSPGTPNSATIPVNPAA